MIRQTANTALSLACYGGSTAIMAYLWWAAPAALVIMLAIAWCVALLAMGTDSPENAPALPLRRYVRAAQLNRLDEPSSDPCADSQWAMAAINSPILILRVEEAEQAAHIGDFQTARDIQAALAAGDSLSQFLAEVAGRLIDRAREQHESVR